jgi:hypothetical protein
MSYDESQPRLGATGLEHASAAEAKASFRLAPLGILPHDVAYPVTFKDRTGATFTARSDFRHERSGVMFEFKASNLNSKTTIATAAKAEARVMRDEALGFLNPRNRTFRLLDAQWNHSLYKQAAVVASLSPASVVLVLKEAPDAKEAERLTKAGIFWRTLKTISPFALYLKLAALGLDVGFTASACPKSDEGPWHVFGNAAAG